MQFLFSKEIHTEFNDTANLYIQAENILKNRTEKISKV